jgi:hypothetical protein
MARITICDLCKQRIKDDESKQGELTLSFYVANVPKEASLCDNAECGAIPGVYCDPCSDKGLLSKHTALVAELCHSCTTLICKTITGDDPLIKPQVAPQIAPQRVGQRPQATPSVAYAPPEKALGPSEEEKAERTPTKDLLEDEMVKVPSRFDRTVANKAVSEQKGTCAHHFKSFRDGKVVCGNAPDGFKGDLASFRGCGNVLTAAEY